MGANFFGANLKAKGCSCQKATEWRTYINIYHVQKYRTKRWHLI